MGSLTDRTSDGELRERRQPTATDSVALAWNDNPSNETGFTMKRATDAGFTANVATYTVGVNVQAYTQSVLRGQTYYHRVQAFNAAGASAFTVGLSPSPKSWSPLVG